MIDVLHLYGAADAVRGNQAASGTTKNRRTLRSQAAATGRFRSANPVVSHLPIEIRCNLYWLCITEHRIAFVRAHYVGPSGVYCCAISGRSARRLHTARIDQPAHVFRRRTMPPLPTFKTPVSVHGVTMPSKQWLICQHYERVLLLVARWVSRRRWFHTGSNDLPLLALMNMYHM